MQGSRLIQLDSEAFVWVLLPVLVITFCSALTRQALNYLSMLSGTGAAGPQLMIKDFAEVHANNVTAASKLARTNAAFLSPVSLEQRKQFFIGSDSDGKLHHPPPAPEQQTMPQMDPSSMLGGMKYKFLSLILDGGLAYLISYLFSECVIARLPFTLSDSFKPILQRGIQVPDLDAGYISALSWYFLILFCSGSYTHLFHYVTEMIPTGHDATTLMMLNPMAQGAPMPLGQFDAAKAFQQEADHWKLLTDQHGFLSGIEQAALRAI